jgi:hypothetical protein
MMKLITKAAVAASSLTLLAAAPVSAMTTTSGAYTQTTSGLSCTGHVQDDGDGGTLSVKVAGHETRPSDKHFRSWRVYTWAVAQEKSYNGTWVDVATSKTLTGKLGSSYSNDAGTVNYSPYKWWGGRKYSYTPTLRMAVAGFDDLFRAKVVTKVYDDEGAMIKQLTTIQGQCRL